MRAWSDVTYTNRVQKSDVTYDGCSTNKQSRHMRLSILYPCSLYSEASRQIT